MSRCAIILALALCAPLQAQVVNTVISNGTTETRYDMVILGDGYRASEQLKFNNDVTAFLTALFAKAPYAAFASYYNVHTVFRASVDSGADRPDETPPVYVNTVYDATYTVTRQLLDSDGDWLTDEAYGEDWFDWSGAEDLLTDEDGVIGAHHFSTTLEEHNEYVEVCRELGYCG